MKNFFLILIVYSLLIVINGTAYSQSEKNWQKTSTGSMISNDVNEMAHLKMGPFVRLNDNSILTVDDTKSLISHDEGKTWNDYEIFAEPEKFRISNERALIETRDGVVILAFMNLTEKRFDWQKEISDAPEAKLPTYTARSLDGGKTWEDVQKIHNGYTGAIRSIIETQNNNIVFTSMMLQHNPAHNSILTYTSRNEGKDWEQSNIIDVGGIGDHSGVMEGTIVQLKNGNLWMLMRTNWGTFWEATSDNDGLEWKEIKPTAILASSAPGLLSRLNSGRIILIYNQLMPEGEKEVRIETNTDWSEINFSNHREELSISFSNDEGENWSSPIVVAKTIDSSGSIAYPYLFEPTPGELWITTIQGTLRINLRETDFVK